MSSSLLRRMFETEAPYVKESSTQTDLLIATLAFGWTLGFGFFVTWHAIQQSRRLGVYLVMIWLEIFTCAVFAVICWLYLLDLIPHNFWFYFWILTCWALQVQLLLQIIINRINLLAESKRKQRLLKYGVAAFITAINISVYCIWIPARLQISQRYIHINEIWDRIEKALYLLVDAWLNWLFIKAVQQRLVSHGLDRYKRLVKFNKIVIVVSLSMDVFIIAMMSYPNSFVYMQIHPLAYMTKLNIEMAMGQMLVEIASETSAVRPTKTDWEKGLRIEVETEAVVSEVELEERKQQMERPTRARARPGLENRMEAARRYLQNGGDPEKQLHACELPAKTDDSASSTPSVDELDEKKLANTIQWADEVPKQ